MKIKAQIMVGLLGLALSAFACGDEEKNEDLGDEPATEASDLGDQCEGNGDCSADTCLFKVQEDGSLADYGYCSGTCESFSECPEFWNCEGVGNGSAKYCVQGS